MSTVVQGTARGSIPKLRRWQIDRAVTIVPGRTCRTIGWSVEEGGSITRMLQCPLGPAGWMTQRLEDDSGPKSRGLTRMLSRIRGTAPVNGGPSKGALSMIESGGAAERILVSAMHHLGARHRFGACLAGRFAARAATAPCFQPDTSPAARGYPVFMADGHRSREGHVAQALCGMQA